MSKEGLFGVSSVGDQVVLTDVNWKGPRRVCVDAVGRKYATIGRRKFDLSDGVVADAYRHTRAFTLAQWTRRELEASLDAAIRKVGEVRSFAHLTDDGIREATRMLEEVAARLIRQPS